MECALSTSLIILSVSIEALFLSLEHDVLTSDINTSSMPAYYTSLDTPSPETPSAPDPSILSQMYVRSGPHDRSGLEEATRKILQSLLRRHRSILPHRTWRTVCMKAMHTINGTIKMLQKSAPSKGASLVPVGASEVLLTKTPAKDTADADISAATEKAVRPHNCHHAASVGKSAAGHTGETDPLRSTSQDGSAGPDGIADAGDRIVCSGGSAFTGVCEEAYSIEAALLHQVAAGEHCGDNEEPEEMSWALLGS